MARTKDEFVLNLTSDQAYEKLLGEFQAEQNFLGCTYILWACLAGVIVPTLLWKVSKSSLPEYIRPFWNIYGISVLLAAPLILLRWTRSGRKAQIFKDVGRAINAFERAKKYHANWRKSHRKHDLKESYEYLKLAEKYLNNVPMFKAIQKEINIAYQETFDK